MLYDNLGGEIGLVFEGSSDGEDIYIYLWLNHIVVLQKPTQSCKGIILHLKNKDLNNCHSFENESRSVVSSSLQPHGHGILYVRILQWVAAPFFRGSSEARDQTQVSDIVGRFFIS